MQFINSRTSFYSAPMSDYCFNNTVENFCILGLKKKNHFTFFVALQQLELDLVKQLVNLCRCHFARGSKKQVSGTRDMIVRKCKKYTTKHH